MDTDLEHHGPPTRLNLESFMYSPQPRRSARLSSTPRPASPALPASRKRPSPSPSCSGANKIAPERDERTEKGETTQASPRKRRRTGYAPPSTYAHLPLLPDAVVPNLLVFFVGLNPGIETSRRGHAYAHPSNLFWKLLFASGVTPRPCRAEEDRRMPELFGLGLTNIVARPSRSGAELSRREMDEGVAALEDKARRWRPETMCLVGKGIWESVWRVRHGSPVGAAFRYGWQDEAENMGVVPGEWGGARVFVATSTSGLAASSSPAEKLRVWSELGAWVKARRAERDEKT